MSAFSAGGVEQSQVRRASSAIAPDTLLRELGDSDQGRCARDSSMMAWIFNRASGS